MGKTLVFPVVLTSWFLLYQGAAETHEKPPATALSTLAIHYRHAGLTEIHIADGNLTYVWHTFKEGLVLMRQDMSSYDRHEVVITLAPSDLELCSKWITEHGALSLKPPQPVRGRKSYGSAFKSRLAVNFNGESNAVAWHGDHRYRDGRAAAGGLIQLSVGIIKRKLPRTGS